MSGELHEQFNTIVKLADTISSQKLGAIGNADYVNYASGISDGCRRLSQVMNWIGELGRLEAGRMSVNHSKFSLAGPRCCNPGFQPNTLLDRPVSALTFGELETSGFREVSIREVSIREVSRDVSMGSRP